MQLNESVNQSIEGFFGLKSFIAGKRRCALGKTWETAIVQNGEQIAKTEIVIRGEERRRP